MGAGRQATAVVQRRHCIHSTYPWPRGECTGQEDSRNPVQVRGLRICLNSGVGYGGRKTGPGERWCLPGKARGLFCPRLRVQWGLSALYRALAPDVGLWYQRRLQNSRWHLDQCQAHQHLWGWSPLTSIHIAKDSMFSWPLRSLVDSFQPKGSILHSSWLECMVAFFCCITYLVA